MGGFEKSEITHRLVSLGWQRIEAEGGSYWLRPGPELIEKFTEAMRTGKLYVWEARDLHAAIVDMTGNKDDEGVEHLYDV
jgi:hypothetical protein